ncbi:MAG: PQQ-like beta-propeller repeat protein [Bacteroidetes bacterium]|nr:PQQ-like beta-propeller repeat protein [Bacteroidota bacterium]MCL2303674.1 PQQ-like beta-propeller repeat protein [Lentimicrobiaceae bacterium]
MKSTFFLILTCVTLSLSAQNSNIQWRNDRTGIYNEKGLLKSWPTTGPELLWYYDELDEGHSSIAIDADKLYVTGMTGDVGYLYVFDLNGKLLNKKGYGKEWDKSYNGSRGTPTINDGKIYIHTGLGDLICMDQNSLEILWKKNMMTDFGGENIRWGVTESPLIIDDKVILTVGGKEHNIVALNKNDGSLIWSSKGDGDLSSYCSPLYIANQQIPQIVTMMEKHIIGIDAATGKKLWSHTYETQRGIHPNTPVYDGKDMVLCASGYGKGSVMLRLINGGRNVEKVWESQELETKTGGMVKVGDYAYASGDHNKFWYCLDWNTGKTMYKDNALGGTGVTIANDGMLYCYSEKGLMSLVRATPEKFDIVSTFPITLGTDQHWAHPVIYKGVLYVRHGNTLMAYKIK